MTCTGAPLVARLHVDFGHVSSAVCMAADPPRSLSVGAGRAGTCPDGRNPTRGPAPLHTGASAMSPTARAPTTVLRQRPQGHGHGPGTSELLTPNERVKKDDDGSTCAPASRTSTPRPASPPSTRPTCAAGCAGGASTPSASPASTAARPRSSSRTSSTTSSSCCGCASTAASSAPSSCGSSPRSRRSSAATPPTSPTGRTSSCTGSASRTSPRSGSGSRRSACPRPRPAATPPGHPRLPGRRIASTISTARRHRRDPAAFIKCRSSNLPRKFKTAISGSPLQDVAHEVNDISFIGVLHPELGPGFDVWVGGGLSTNPMLAQRLGAWVSWR